MRTSTPAVCNRPPPFLWRPGDEAKLLPTQPRVLCTCAAASYPVMCPVQLFLLELKLIPIIYQLVRGREKVEFINFLHGGKGLELPSIVYREGGVKFIIPFIPSEYFNSFPSCTIFLRKGRVKLILNFNTGKERLN